MDSLYHSLPEKIKDHLDALTSESSRGDKEKFREELAQNWSTKHELFKSQAGSLGMVDVDSFNSDDPSGALMLTYSGSLVGVGTMQEGCRRIEYYSIKLRGDVPEAVKIDGISIVNRAATGRPLELSPGPLQKTSSLYLIARFTEDVPLEEQETRLKEAIIFLTNGFIKINRSLADLGETGPGQFTMKSIVSQLSQRNDLPQKTIKSILDDYWMILESGILLGEKVSLGKIGKVYLKNRGPQKARIGKNPKTGEDFTIRAKPEMAVPKMSFSSHLKEKAGQSG